MARTMLKKEFGPGAVGFPVTLTEWDDGSPIRPILDGRRSRPVWNYYSLKNGRSLPCESSNELHSLYHSEVSHSVLRYRVQPHTALFVIGGRTREYTPDLEETLVNGRVVITEVKDIFEENEDPGYTEKLRYARAFYETQGIAFRILERAEIESRPVFDTVEAIQAFRRTMITAADVLQVRSIVGTRDSAPLAEVRDSFKTSALGFAKLAAMMVRRIISIDLEHDLKPHTPIRLLTHKET